MNVIKYAKMYFFSTRVKHCKEELLSHEQVNRA